MKFSIKNFWKLEIWWHLLNKSLMENFIFCAVSIPFIFRFILFISTKQLKAVTIRTQLHLIVQTQQ